MSLHQRHEPPELANWLPDGGATAHNTPIYSDLSDPATCNILSNCSMAVFVMARAVGPVFCPCSIMTVNTIRCQTPFGLLHPRTQPTLILLNIHISTVPTHTFMDLNIHISTFQRALLWIQPNGTIMMTYLLRKRKGKSLALLLIWKYLAPPTYKMTPKKIATQLQILTLWKTKKTKHPRQNRFPMWPHMIILPHLDPTRSTKGQLVH